MQMSRRNLRDKHSRHKYGRGTVSAIVSIAIVAIVSLSYAALRRHAGSGGHAYKSVAKTYVPSSECALCHSEIAASFAGTGMAHSFYRAADDPITRNLRGEVIFRHNASQTTFSMVRQNGKLYQKRWQIDAGGKPTNVDLEQVDYVVGSGNHVRTYLHRNANGTITELPLAWYAEKGGAWAMNPGFDNAAPPTRRTLSYECMFCHNSYPQLPADLGDPTAYPVYAGDLPEGIGCQRCHGPGSAHVQAARTPGATLEQIRAAIVNPARLSNERQMEICMQCHLEVTSRHLPDRIRSYDRRPFGYTPDQPLGNFLHYFQRDLEGRPDPRFEIVSAAYRLRQSRCFLQSNGALTCERCHDPHQPYQAPAAERHYTATCLNCHAAGLATMVAEHKHTAATGCIACHMPKRRTDDVVHVLMTDHLIQRVAPPSSVLLAAKPEIDESPEAPENSESSYRGEVLPYRFTQKLTPDDDLYTATAQVMHDSNSVAGIPRLAALIAQRHPAEPEFATELGDALHRSGAAAQAIDAYREALAHDPHSLRAQRSLGIALEQAGAPDQALAEFQSALEDHPNDPLTWYEMGLLYGQSGQLGQAITELTKATQLDPTLAEAYNNLGIALAQSGQPDAAEKAFRESLRIAPYDAGAKKNLGILLASKAAPPQ